MSSLLVYMLAVLNTNFLVIPHTIKEQWVKANSITSRSSAISTKYVVRTHPILEKRELRARLAAKDEKIRCIRTTYTHVSKNSISSQELAQSSGSTWADTTRNLIRKLFHDIDLATVICVKLNGKHLDVSKEIYDNSSGFFLQLVHIIER
ncbi:unnamed protein product [Didymodactylos carnosus]|uniref:Uncharacterized protein n=1 Tax=Didymodactylos carnosus TaxID=1234261 RepID=A0A814RVP4_9BILA|nr:unnamed protein product [Didymodactylos carnosus]CAF1537539.1 unnamed protein product [Didymodactylos carnosus]CAF3903279.1 unnamed protein product [Didymodactylos carnosus]CAF4325359.1 unnamed protein product [Didymodactylos carnosus]